jgi:hypothetical protein
MPRFDGTNLRERAGEKLGDLLAPLIAGVSRARHARMFHPDGRTFTAHVDPLDSAEFGALGASLAGTALARFSGALWRRGFEHFDVLGVALRFRPTPQVDAIARPGDQDLLLATIISPFTMPFAPFTTNPHDFFANQYWAVSPFEIPSGLRVKFRLSAHPPLPPARAARERQLLAATEQHRAIWTLEARRTFRLAWTPIATLNLLGIADLDQATLRFSPFNIGKGIVPRGLVHAMRRPTYRASQQARPDHNGG